MLSMYNGQTYGVKIMLRNCSSFPKKTFRKSNTIARFDVYFYATAPRSISKRITSSVSGTTALRHQYPQEKHEQSKALRNVLRTLFTKNKEKLTEKGAIFVDRRKKIYGYFAFRTVTNYLICVSLG